ncbi:HAD-IC family P-type ATPase, partial [Bifidobacterium sp. M0353]|nr:HAD-IC family P-type ATPase [Bifidobacterium sp. M0353]
VMVLLSGVLSFWQEYRSNKAAQALKSMISTTATVVRRSHRDINAEQLEVPIKEVVPGDIILLSAGDMVPADVRLIESRDLFISQAVLTGESIPVEKSDTLGMNSTLAIEEQPLSADPLDAENICF